MGRIVELGAQPILDSRGEWTIEVLMRLSDGSEVKSSVPKGKSLGSHEAHYQESKAAIAHIHNTIAPHLKRRDPAHQEEIDACMRELDGTADKSRLGANTIIGVSIACARAGAFLHNLPLWKHLRELADLSAADTEKHGMPRLFINMINGGLHAGNNLDFQEYLVIPRTHDILKAINTGTALYHALREYLIQTKGKQAINVGDEGGFAPQCRDNLEPFLILQNVLRPMRLGCAIDFGLDAAASTFTYEYRKLLGLYHGLSREFPLCYMEDPFGEEEFDEYALLRESIGHYVLIAGDDLTVTNVARMQKARENQSINAVVIKPNQVGTVSEALEAVRCAREWGWAVVVSHRSGETNDDFIADLAVGIGAEGIKLGAPVRGERVAKYNRLLEIATSEYL